MKIAFLTSLLVMSLNVFANDGVLEIHGNFEDEKYCSQQIRNLGCGNPEASAFNTCVNKKVSELEPKCQDFHLDEMDRQLDSSDSKARL
ncbi:MAG TPA: hypothetical protein VKZ84_04865 [Bacteriovoracaceae bacterium]|nr:hypothetical protein [Bacteriovoracaceae bacterium]